MMLWMILGGLTAATLLALVLPLLRQRPAEQSRASYDVTVFRDQLAEIDRDLARGVLAPSEAASVRLEIERRLLAAAKGNIGDQIPAASRPMPLIATLLALLVPAATFALYATLGSPGATDRPFADRAVERSIVTDDGSLDFQKVRAALMARLQNDPGSLEGWVYLARTDTSLEDWPAAEAAWARARELSHDAPVVVEQAAETLVRQAQGAVTPDAQKLFQQALTADPTRLRSRYYLAVAHAQSGDKSAALAGFQSMLHDLPTNSPWRGQVADAIKSLTIPQPAVPPSDANASAGDAGAGAPSGPMAGMIMNLPPEQRMQAIQGMVAGLAARLGEHPGDLDGWKRLARAYGVLAQPAKSADAFGQAAKLDPKDPALLVGEANAIGATLPDGTPPSPLMIDLMRRALALDPAQPEALWVMGLDASLNHRKPEAAAYWRKLLAGLDPSSSDYTSVKQALDGLGS